MNESNVEQKQGDHSLITFLLKMAVRDIQTHVNEVEARSRKVLCSRYMFEFNEYHTSQPQLDFFYNYHYMTKKRTRMKLYLILHMVKIEFKLTILFIYLYPFIASTHFFYLVPYLFHFILLFRKLNTIHWLLICL